MLILCECWLFAYNYFSFIGSLFSIRKIVNNFLLKVSIVFIIKFTIIFTLHN
jgi:hypothetical protein